MTMYGVIYVVTNIGNGKRYVGQTIRTITQRFNEHARHSSSPLYHAITKYGRQSFTVEVVDSALTLDELNEKEKQWIARCNTVSPHGYNLTTGGEGLLGRKLSVETKRKISVAHTGKKLSPEHRAKVGRRGDLNLNFGKPLSAETREKIAAAHRGKPLSPEHRAKVGRSGNQHYFFW